MMREIMEWETFLSMTVYRKVRLANQIFQVLFFNPLELECFFSCISSPSYAFFGFYVAPIRPHELIN